MAVILLIGAQTSAAQTPPMGAGTQSCGHWVKTRASAEDADIVGEGMMTAWVQGFVTGIWLVERMGGTLSFSIPDAGAIQSWLDTRCEERPLEQLVTAGAALVKQLKARN
jgi:hypothetical protein